MLKKSAFIALSLTVFLVIGCGPKLSDSEMFAQANQLQREGKYEDAIASYKSLVSSYPKSTYAPQAQFMVGFIYANELKKIDEAKTAYEKFIKDFPEHEMVKDARWEIEHLGQDIQDIEDLIVAGDSTKNADTLKTE